MMKLILILLLLVPTTAATAGDTINAEQIAAASGWKTQEIDLDITIVAQDEYLTVEGRMVLQLEQGPKRSLGLLLNSRRPEMQLEALRVVRADGVDPAEVRIESDLRLVDVDSMRIELLHFPDEMEAGTKVELAFSYRSDGQSQQVIIRPDIAYASWVEAWYPIPVDDNDPEDPHSGAQSRGPGKTTFRLPAGWWALSNGKRIERTTTNNVVEVWEDTFGTARSFVAGPYLDPAEVTIGDRTVAVYLLTPKALDARAQAERLNQAIDVLSERFGPYPFGTFAIAEAPNDIKSFGAASEQGFIVAVTSFFDAEDGNLALFSHEAGHTWWGNLVSSTGDGSYLCSESMAQYGAVLAIEAVEGREAALDFLEFSRASYVPNQCARGYFAYVRLGVDRPMSALDNTTRFDHTLSDAKGHWVYHMLRGTVGDDVFFATLRDIVVRYTDEQLSLDKLREEFIAAAPDAGLEQFFEQWLDRKGAPVVDLQWTLEKQMKDNPYVEHQLESIIIGEEESPFEVTVVLEQLQTGEPYVLDIEVEIEFTDGTTTLKTLHVDDRRLETTLQLDALPRDIRLDPHRKTLLWRPVYGPRPESDVAANDAETD
jgi:hypothetical protein